LSSLLQVGATALKKLLAVGVEERGLACRPAAVLVGGRRSTRRRSNAQSQYSRRSAASAMDPTREDALVGPISLDRSWYSLIRKARS
jgi:hypothetical protein